MMPQILLHAATLDDRYLPDRDKGSPQSVTFLMPGQELHVAKEN